MILAMALFGMVAFATPTPANAGICPDGTYGCTDTTTINPDGTYCPSGGCTIQPDGTFK